jgi:hypothetical protein
VPLLRPEPLNDAHELSDFFCGIASLDDWLKKRGAPRKRHSETGRFSPAERTGGVEDFASGVLDDKGQNEMRQGAFARPAGPSHDAVKQFHYTR